MSPHTRGMIMVVESDRVLRAAITRLLIDDDWQTVECSDLIEASQTLAALDREVTMVLFDVHAQRGSTREFVRRVRHTLPNAAVVGMCTEQHDPRWIERFQLDSFLHKLALNENLLPMLAKLRDS